jgi:hypothetical protein
MGGASSVVGVDSRARTMDPSTTANANNVVGAADLMTSRTADNQSTEVASPHRCPHHGPLLTTYQTDDCIEILESD